MLGWFCLLVGSTAADVVELPPLFISGYGDQLPWEYARSEDAEVLTLCDRSITSDYIRAVNRGSLFVPEDFKDRGSRPLRFILFDLAPTTGTPPPSLTRPVSKEFGYAWVRTTNVRGGPGEIEAANLFKVRDWPELDAHALGYYFGNVRPAGPTWLREGLLGSWGALSGLAGYSQEPRLARLSGFAWDQVDFVHAAIKADEGGHGLYPLAELFESPPPEDAELRRRWELQAALFCRWQIYSNEGQRKGGNAFWNWARLARKGEVDEAGFRRYFGVDYAAAEQRMLRYLKRVLDNPQDVPIKGFSRDKDLELRRATAEEIARLLGAFQWQEAKRLRAEGETEEARRYEVAARRTYVRGLQRTTGHAALHAGLGLLEHEAGCTNEARTHLEKAFADGGVDAMALLVLARLRFDQARAEAGLSGKLGAAQITFTLAPAFAARSETPVGDGVYRLIAEVWSQSAFTPEAKYLNVLLEGVGNYPHDLDLAYQVAAVHARYGYRDIAEAVARRAARLAGRSNQRIRFESLLAGIAQP